MKQIPFRIINDLQEGWMRFIGKIRELKNPKHANHLLMFQFLSSSKKNFLAEKEKIFGCLIGFKNCQTCQSESDVFYTFFKKVAIQN